MKRPTGAAPYGFQWEESGVLTHDPRHAPIRQLIFDLFLDSRNQTAVAKKLNAMGNRTRTGSEWMGVQVRRALECPSAIGRYPVNKTVVDESGKRVALPESDWQIIECPPLVSQDVWEAVQAVLHGNDSPPVQTGRATHTFTGLIHCGCGGKMEIASPSTSYRCPNCKAKFSAVELERIFAEDLEDYLVTDPDLDESQVVGLAAAWPTFSQEQRRGIVLDTLDSLTVDKSNLHFTYRFPQSIKDAQATRQTASSTNRNSTNATDLPNYIRLPKSGGVCPHSGLSRAKLNQLILPNERNGYSPPVQSKSACVPGKRRGVRLIHLQSLLDYLAKLQ